MPQKHKINFHKEKIMERERNIFKTSLIAEQVILLTSIIINIFVLFYS